MKSKPPLPVLLVAALSLAHITPAADSDWQTVECIPADPSVEASFEVMQSLDGFESEALQWHVAGGDQHAAATARRDARERRTGEGALRVDYDFAGKPGLEYLELSGPGTFSQPGLGIGFWLKADGTPFVLRLRIADASGETHQTELLDSGGSGWRVVAGALDGPSESWGGDGNHRKDYPCKLVGIVLDRPQNGFKGQGSLWLDDVAIIRPVKATTRNLQVEVQPRRFGNLYAVGDTLRVRAGGGGQQLRWVLTDFAGQVHARGEGPVGSTEARFTLDEPGWFYCRLELLAEGKVVGTQMFQCAALPGGRVETASDFLGMCSHFGQSAYPLESMELMRQYGVDQFRDEVSWRSFERDKGQLALPAYADKFLRRAAELKMRPLLIYDYSNPHYDDDGFPNSPAAIAAFARYALELTRQTRGQVNQFEVWNEWVGACGMKGRPGRHDGEAYGRVLQATYQAVKREFPDLTVVGIGGEYGPKCAEHIRTVAETAGPASMDAWSIHPYRYPRSPESSDLVGEVSGLASKVAAAGVKTRAWITEIGYPTHRGNAGSSLQVQARLAVRTVALLQAMPEVGKVFWYDFKDDGLTREYNEDNFGVVHHQRFNCAPKPAAIALSTFIRLTAGAQPKGLLRSGEVWAVSFQRPDKTDLVVAWCVKGTAKPTWTGEVLALTDLMGKGLAVSPTPELSENPVYLTGQKLRLTDSKSAPEPR